MRIQNALFFLLAYYSQQVYASEPIENAVEKGDTAAVSQLLSANPSLIHHLDLEQDNWSLLHSASFKGDYEMAKYLLEKGADIHAKTSYNWTPLHKAVEGRNKLIVELLLHNGADIEAKTTNDWTPLFVAADDTDSVLVDYLLSMNASPNIVTKPNAWTPLIQAAYLGSFQMVNSLLNRKADIKAITVQGWNPLHEAVESKNEKIVDLLLRKGSDIEAKTNSGWTPLYIAINDTDSVMTKYLISKGAHTNTADTSGFSVLHLAAKIGNLSIAKLLIASGAKVNIREREGWTPLHMASRFGKQRIASLLLAHGANAFSRNNSGATPLHWSTAMESDTSCISLFLKRGLKIDELDSLGLTPLHYAAFNGNSAIIIDLIKKGASINKRNKSAETPLWFAAQQGNKDAAEVLVKNGADIKAANDSGQIPQLVARINNKTEVLNYLSSLRTVIIKGRILNLDNKPVANKEVILAEVQEDNENPLYPSRALLRKNEGQWGISIAKSDSLGKFEFNVKGNLFFANKVPYTIVVNLDTGSQHSAFTLKYIGLSFKNDTSLAAASFTFSDERSDTIDISKISDFILGWKLNENIPDNSKAVKPYLVVCANEGYKEAYEKGNYKDAIDILEQLCERDDPDASYFLGKMYISGNGIDQNFERAYFCFGNAAKLGHCAAQEALGMLWAKGFKSNHAGFLQSYETAMGWLMEAARKANKDALYDLGVLYEKHLIKQKIYIPRYNNTPVEVEIGGGPDDIEKAISYYTEAARLGHELAKKSLKRLGIK